MQVYFLFLETLGTPEMILIALVALIIFGPRKLPQIGRTIGKYTAEFKRASRDFRDTFEREVEMAELEDKQTAAANVSKNAESSVEPSNDFNAVENTIGRTSSKTLAPDQNGFAAVDNDLVAASEIQEVSKADFAMRQDLNQTKILETAETAEMPRSKREWL